MELKTKEKKDYPVNLALDYLMRESFSVYKDWDLMQSIREKYLNGEWDDVILSNYKAYRYSTQRYGITKSAIKLVNRVKDELDIDLFPVIHRTYVGHWQRSNGALTWTVDGNDRNYWTYGSCCRVADFIKKSYKLDTLMANFGIVESFAEKPLVNDVKK